MHPEKYSLKWHTYTDHLRKMMAELMMNDNFFDVTLVTEDKKQIKANINILSACSPVLKDILKEDKNSNQIMYLRGIQFSEMESIIQFIYLGEATFYKERMDEFLSVAKSLQIKELCNAQNESEDESEHESEDEPKYGNPETSTENFVEQTVTTVHLNHRAQQDKREGVVSVKGKLECDECNKTYFSRGALYSHKQSKHRNVKFPCDQCESHFTEKWILNKHILSKHKGMKYPCNQCDYQASRISCLTIHIQSKHEGVRYACDQCEYQATTQSNLARHNQLMHEGVKYACNQCDFQFTQQGNLSRHIKSAHEL